MVFEETEKGPVLKPLAEVEDSAGALSSSADMGEVLGKHLEDRRKSFR